MDPDDASFMYNFDPHLHGEPASPLFRDMATSVYKTLYDIVSIIVRVGEEHHPMILLFDPKSGDLLHNKTVSINSTEDKDRLVVAQRMLASNGAIVCLIFESWVVKLPSSSGTPEEVSREFAGRSLAHHPDREEMIVFNFAYKRECMIAFCDIDRASSTLARGELRDALDIGVRGRFVRDKKLDS